MHRYLDWEQVRQKLDGYPCVAQHFPLDILRQSAECAPFYCHYVAWRLGACRSTAWLARLESLLTLACQIPGWRKEFKPLQRRRRNTDYHSLVWQMQVAEFLSERGAGLTWQAKGPDLKVTLEGRIGFVECSFIAKSWSLEGFLREILHKIDPGLKLERRSNVPFRLPGADVEVAAFLDTILAPLLDNQRLDYFGQLPQHNPRTIYDAQPAYPFAIALYGPDSAEYLPLLGVPGTGASNAHGDPSGTFRDVANRVVVNKGSENAIAHFRPNLLLVNGIALDWQFSIDDCRSMPHLRPDITLPKGVDGAVFACLDEADALGAETPVVRARVAAPGRPDAWLMELFASCGSAEPSQPTELRS